MTYPDNSVHQYQYDGVLGRLQQLNTVTDTTQWLQGGKPPEGIKPFCYRSLLRILRHCRSGQPDGLCQPDGSNLELQQP